MKITHLNAEKNAMRNFRGIFIKPAGGDSGFLVIVSVTGQGTNHMMDFKTEAEAVAYATRLKNESYTGLRVYRINFG